MARQAEDVSVRIIRPGTYNEEEGVWTPTPWEDLKTTQDPELKDYQRNCALVILSYALRLSEKDVVAAHEAEDGKVPLRSLLASAGAVARFAEL